MNKQPEQVFIVNAAPTQPSSSPPKLLGVEVSDTSQVNLENVEDFSHVCRICATITEFVIPIFSGEGLQNNLADKIHKHLPIKVCATDTLPVVVCYQCASTLLAWHELVQCCVQADAALRARLDAIQQKSTAQVITDTPSTEDDALSKLFYKNVKNALIEFGINVEQGEPDVEFVCQKCSEKPALSTARSLARHVRHQHSTDVQADNVHAFITNYVTFEQVLADDSDRETHSDTQDKSPVQLAQLICPFCGSVLSSATRLVHHLNRHVPVCLAAGADCCGHSYTRPRALAQHLQDAHVRGGQVGAQPCCSCGFSAADNDQLKQHYQTAHGDRNTKQKKVESPNNQKYIPAVCPECNKTFSNKYNMFTHLRSHSAPGARHACPRCPRSYSRRGALAQHVRVAHEGRLPHVCATCGDAFPSRAQRDVHARLHSGSAPYACTRCGKAFRAKNTLARHMEMHLGIRRYKCEICFKAFRKKSHLDYHITTHMK
ncbi:zinc finger protein 84 isoform X2 [Helicoverpa armigera]|uniref:zinc finger protein 84 isoform X2 n=1 Tax=Helicoverpa armigera TaxID=29058 RepID=UPI0030830BDB